MQNSADTKASGPNNKPRPKSFVGGDSFELFNDAGLKSTTRSLDRKDKRPMSLFESLSQDMYARRRNSSSSSRPDDAGHEKAKSLSSLDSKEKGDEDNKDGEESKQTINNDAAEEGIGARKGSESAESRKAARQLYAELSSPPLKTGGDEKFNAVSRLRSLFDQTNSAPPSQRNVSAPLRPKDGSRFSSANNANRKSVEEGSKMSPVRHEQAKLDFQQRRPKFERVEAEKKRKLFAPPPAVKLDALLKRESPRTPKSPEENKDLRFPRSITIEKEPPAKTNGISDRRKDQKDALTKNMSDIVKNSRYSSGENRLINDKDPRMSRPHSYIEKSSGAENDKFEKIHERRRSLPKKRASSFEFDALEDNIEVYGKKTIDINAMLGLDPPREEPVVEVKDGPEDTEDIMDEEIVKDDDKVVEAKPEVSEDMPNRQNEPHDDVFDDISEKIPTETKSEPEEVQTTLVEEEKEQPKEICSEAAKKEIDALPSEIEMEEAPAINFNDFKQNVDEAPSQIPNEEALKICAGVSSEDVDIVPTEVISEEPTGMSFEDLDKEVELSPGDIIHNEEKLPNGELMLDDAKFVENTCEGDEEPFTLLPEEKEAIILARKLKEEAEKKLEIVPKNVDHVMPVGEGREDLRNVQEDQTEKIPEKTKIEVSLTNDPSAEEEGECKIEEDVQNAAKLIDIDLPEVVAEEIKEDINLKHDVTDLKKNEIQAKLDEDSTYEVVSEQEKEKVSLIAEDLVKEGNPITVGHSAEEDHDIFEVEATKEDVNWLPEHQDDEEEETPLLAEQLQAKVDAISPVSAKEEDSNVIVKDTKNVIDVHPEDVMEDHTDLKPEEAVDADTLIEIESPKDSHVEKYKLNKEDLPSYEPKVDDNDNYAGFSVSSVAPVIEVETGKEEDIATQQMKDIDDHDIEEIQESVTNTDQQSDLPGQIENLVAEKDKPVHEEIEVSLSVNVESSNELDYGNVPYESEDDKSVEPESDVVVEKGIDIMEDLIMPEKTLEAESAPNSAFLNDEVECSNELENDSFDSFALNVKEEARVIVDKAISEAVLESVEKRPEEETDNDIQNTKEEARVIVHKAISEAVLESVEKEKQVESDMETQIEEEDHVNEESEKEIKNPSDKEAESEIMDSYVEEAMDSQKVELSEDKIEVSEVLPDEEKVENEESSHGVDTTLRNEKGESNDTEVANPLHDTVDTVELDDEEYDSDHSSAVSEGSPQEYSFHEDSHDLSDGDEEETKDHPDYINISYKPKDDYDDVNEDDEEEDHEDDQDYNEDQYEPQNCSHYEENTLFSEKTVYPEELPPPPSQSCIKANNDKEKRRVSFHGNISDVIYTYSPEEYNRGNNEIIDTVTASAEWELEKRVEEKDIFSVDLDKSEGGLGLSIIGLGVSTESGVEKLGIFIKSLTPNGAAHRDRRIQVQDQILEVNGISLVGVTQIFAAQTLKNTSGNVRFLMGRDKVRKHYQAPTSTADATLQELEQKHNIEMSELTSKLHRAEDRASLADRNLEEIREALLDAEDRLHTAEAELEEAREEINVMRQSPLIPSRKLKTEIKRKQSPKHSEKIEDLERTVEDLTSQLFTSEEKLKEIQDENNATIDDLKARLEVAEQQHLKATKESDHLVLMSQRNAEKLNDQNETVVGPGDDDTLKERCVELENEIQKLKEENAEIKKEKESKSDSEDHARQIARLEDEARDLKKELDLKKKFSDVVIAERDSFKNLVDKLERAHENLQEGEEKMHIEYAMKKMSYENKIRELEETIKALKGAEAVDSAPHKKLFPEIERSTAAEAPKPEIPKVEQEIKIEKAEPQNTIPVSIPPPDYDEDITDTTKLSADEIIVDRKEIAQEEVPNSVPKPDYDEPDEVIVERKLSVQECTPDFSFIKDTEAAKDAVDGKEADIVVPDEPVIGAIEAVVNPVQKPPRRYSDKVHRLETKPGKLVPMGDLVIEETSREEVISEPEKERNESIQTAFEKLETEENLDSQCKPKEVVETEQSELVEDVSKKPDVENVTPRKEQKILKPEDSFFRDLPESSVDSPEVSDNEVLAEVRDENTKPVKSQVNLANILHSIPPPSSDHLDSPDSNDVPDADPTEVPGAKDKEDGPSFLEDLSKNPSFGSWLNGELTVIDKDRKEEQAEEIANQIVEENKDRGLSDSSSGSDKKHDDDDDDGEKVDLSTSVRLDESYLIASSPRIEEEDNTVSPLLRQESTFDEVTTPTEPVPVDRPASIDLDLVVPATSVLENTVQHDKRKLASAIPRKSPSATARKRSSSAALADHHTPEEPKGSFQASSALSASTDNLSSDPATKKEDKEKRKSIFSFMSKLGGKKKHKRSMENLLAPDGPAATRDPSPSRSDRNDNDEDLVPFDAKYDTEMRHSPSQPIKDADTPGLSEVKVNGDSENTTRVSSGDSHSASSSITVSPVSAKLVASTEDLTEGGDEEDGRERLSTGNRQSWIKRPVNEWDVRQVGLWLIRMELEEYSQTFQERNIDGHELLNLNGARLKDLGVMHGDHRALIKRKIKEFRAAGEKDHKSKKEGKTKDRASKKAFWKGKYTVNQ